jgi:dystroglycan 1
VKWNIIINLDYVSGELTMRSKVVIALTLALTCALVSGKTTDLVQVKWGVADSTATVGRLFRLHVPSDAFNGPIKSLKIKTLEGTEMPKWLEFDPMENVLVGIPSPKDVGQVYLEITAQGPINEASTTFTLIVRNDPSHTSGAPLKFRPMGSEKSGPEFVRCKRHEPETVATIIVDVDVEQLRPSDRLAILKKFLGHMDLQEEMVKVLPVGSSPMYDSNALVSGSGDSVSAKTAGTFMAWPVGCGQVKVGHFPILQRLDDDSGSGRMAKVLGHPIIGWHVTNSHIQVQKRKKRQAIVTATPSITPTAPTATATMTDKTEDAGDQMTRTVPEMTSAAIQPTSVQPEMPKTTEPPKPATTEKPAQVPDTTAKATEPSVTYTEGPATGVVVDPICEPGRAPVAKIDSVLMQTQRFEEGQIIDISIPDDTFVDCEGKAITLKLYKDQTEEIEPDFFIQFDAANKKIIGLPMKGDASRSKYDMNLVGLKDGGEVGPLISSIKMQFRIKEMKNVGSINHELSAILDLDYAAFKADIAQQTLLATKIASLSGDPDASNLVVTKLEAGSVVYGWSNKSLSSSDGCPSAEVNAMTAKLVTEDGQLTDEAIEMMKPFALQGYAAAPAGSCEGDPNFKAISVDKRPPKTTAATVTEAPAAQPTQPKEDKEDADPVEQDTSTVNPEDPAKADVMITTVIPAVVIIVVLLIALAIACICYRRKRKGKLTVEEQDSFVNKGAPVIFPNELEEKPSDVTKPLLVEGNAGPPPEYHRGGTDDSLNNGTTLNHEDDIQEYEPPTPPVTDNSNKPRPSQPTPYTSPPEIKP